jgi:diguanylate cyclase (GGDEF)-like protein
MLRIRRCASRPGRWPLVLRFGLVSAVLAAGLAIILTTWLTSDIRSSNRAHAEDTARYSMSLTVGAIGVNPDSHVSISASQYLQVTNLLKAMVGTGKYVGATAWSAQHTLVYAVEPGRFGTHENSRPQLATALKGQTTSIVVRAPLAGVPDATERSALRRGGPLLEIFVPVILDHQVVAGVEFYQEWAPIQATINHEVHLMLLMVISGLLLLWLCLLRFVMTASSRLRTQVALNLELASHDALTGLPNRKVLRQKVEQSLRASAESGRHTALLLLDLDRFKEVNDTLGHHYGDLLLQQIEPRLRDLLRDVDTVARLGGDEFVVLLTDMEHVSLASSIAKRIGTALTATFELDSVFVDVEVSIGVAVSPQHGIDYDQLLQHADIAMYRAKTSSTGFEVYAADIDVVNPEKLALLGQLRAAIKDPTQLLLHYQPKAHLVTGEVLSVEALVRWQHPTEGLLPPGDFIPLAERTGLIHPLTAQVLSLALAQIRSWRESGLDLKVAVNISTRCLDSNLPGLVSRLLREHQVPAAALELEITESAIMAEPDRAGAVLRKLQSLGVGLSIDDFGTGYSSMAYLKKLPVHELKIDQSFITHMTPGSTDAAIVRSCIELARNLGMTVVAEGVETAEVWNQLTELGCDLAQGYYLAKAMPPAQLHAWLTERALRGAENVTKHTAR